VVTIALISSKKSSIAGNWCIPIAVALILANATHSSAQKNEQHPWQVSAGTGMLFYQSVYSLKSSIGLEIAAGKSLNEDLYWEGGVRLGFNPILPEGFVRLGILQRFNKWQPCFALETGITNRANLDSDTNLLKETREAMLNDIGHLYLSAHMEWLSFELRNQWMASFLEVDLGTHYKHFGKTLRFQSTIVRIRKTF
jgi:hypothetical protein